MVVHGLLDQPGSCRAHANGNASHRPWQGQVGRQKVAFLSPATTFKAVFVQIDRGKNEYTRTTE